MAKSKDPRYFILETISIESDKDIQGSRLPTARQVLLCFLAHFTSKSKRDAANKTVKSILPFYNWARIQTIKSNKMAEEIIKLFEELKSLLKIDHAHRNTVKNTQKILDLKTS